jgi:hypothetical protein
MFGLLELENHNAIKPGNRVKVKNHNAWTVPLVELCFAFILGGNDKNH